MCEFEISVGNYYYRCPVPTGNYCFWHEEVKGKRIDSNRIEELRNYNIQWAYLEEAKFVEKNLRGVRLKYANLQKVDLRNADLRGADLLEAQLQNADLVHADLSGANLKWAKVHGAKFWYAKLIGTNLYGVIADEETRFDFADLRYTNLLGSYLDRAKTLRLSKKILDNENKEIYEAIADLLKPSLKEKIRNKICRLSSNLAIIDVKELERENRELANKLYATGVVRYLTEHVEREDGSTESRDYDIAVCDLDRCRIMLIPDRFNRRKQIVNELTEFVDERFDIRNELLGKMEMLYRSSREVYTMLYSFFISNGKMDDAFKVHLKKEEVYKKFLKENGIAKNLLRLAFYGVIKILTGYGLGIKRAIALLTIPLILKTIALFKIAEVPAMLLSLLEILEPIFLALAIFIITYRISR